MNHYAPVFLALGLIAVLVWGCGKSTPDNETVTRFAPGSELQHLADRGFEIFRDPSYGRIAISCLDCHTDYPDSLDPARIRPGHNILGVATRKSTWYGEFSGDRLTPTAAGAAKCAFLYQQRGDDLAQALPPDDARALMAFYRFVSVGSEPRAHNWRALTYPGDPHFKRDSILAILDSLNKLDGDAPRGEALFEKACLFCHNTHGDALAEPQRALRKYVASVFLCVRAGKGSMPFFSYDKLSDRDVADIKEWLRRGAR